jgi:restriction system protein
MKLLEAARAALEVEMSPRKASEIVERVVREGWWSTTGKTPAATLEAQLAVDVRDRGSASPFQRTAPATYALREWGLDEYRPPCARSKGGSSKGTVSFLDAAEAMLEEHGEPMHYRDVTAKAIERGLIETSGRTPEATMSSQIVTEIDRMIKRGEEPRFSKHGKGVVGLARWTAPTLSHQIQLQNREAKRRLRERLLHLSPDQFEGLVRRVLVALGFEDVEVTAMHDSGIDLRGIMVVGGVVRVRMAVQAKRWAANVLKPTVQGVRGSLGAHERGLIVTTSAFSQGAIEESQRPDAVPVALMPGDELVDLLVANELEGVRRSQHVLIELDGPDDEG